MTNPTMRQIVDDKGRTWEAVATPQVVAHLRTGAVLAFRAADAPDAEPIRTPVSFNSPEAADFAIRTMSDRELERRLDWAKTDAGIL
jgi:hypothetical protein